MWLAVGLVLGLIIGAASRQPEVNDATTGREQLSKRLSSTESTLAKAEKELDGTEDELEDLEERYKLVSGSGEVPSFVGDTAADARDDDLAEELGWKFTTRGEVSSEPAGRVIRQVPREGTKLKRGRTITLVVAKKAPPKPKQWVTVKTLSGAGATKTAEFTVPAGATARLAYDMPGDGNNAIWLYRKPAEMVDLVLNEIGPQSGTTRLYQSGTFYLDVTGSYTVRVQIFKRP